MRAQNKAAATIRFRQKSFRKITRIPDEHFQTLPKTDPVEFVENLRVSGENQPGRAERTAEKIAG
jgi:hypothetical protein